MATKEAKKLLVSADQVTKLYIKQDKESADIAVYCQVTTDDEPQIRLIADEFVKVATCTPGIHNLHVIAVVPTGLKRKMKLTLLGGTKDGKTTIGESYSAPYGGRVYEISVTGAPAAPAGGK